jgi:predicted site-specific integrase-resolvase
VQEYMTVEEVAGLLRVEQDTVRAWRLAGDTGPASFKINGRVLYAREDVEAYIADARQAAASEREARSAA